MATLLQHLQAAKGELASTAGSLDDEVRKASLGEAKALVAALEKPQEVIMHYAFHLGAERMAIRVAIDLRLFKVLSEANGKPMTATKLAESSGAELLLVVRLMRVLATINFVKEIDKETYIASELSKAMSTPVAEATVKICKTTYFEYIQADAERLEAFNATMTKIRSTRRHWTEWFPIEGRILDCLSPDTDLVTLIDIGGAKGHDLETLLMRHPETRGHLMLQDLPGTIDTIDSLSEGIKATAHDFFTPQPVQGARAYYMHFTMHDWPDSACRDILRQIKPAMKPGYSKILLNEIVLPDQGCPSEFAAHDINMMCILAGMERTKSHWIELVESVGDLEVMEIHTSPFEGDAEGVVEIMRKEG